MLTADVRLVAGVETLLSGRVAAFLSSPLLVV
jgi:hypothetical protein